MVLVELRRRGAELSYLRSESGREVDALALLPDGQKLLVQVCARHTDRPLCRACVDQPRARPPDPGDAARRLRWRPAIDWLLDDQT